MMNKRTLLSLAPVALLTACGFRLRGVPEFSFASLYVAAPQGSPLARELTRTLEGSGSKLQVLRDPAALPTAQVVLDLLSEQHERAVVGLNASGQVRELELRLRVRFKLRTPAGDELIPDTELLQQREISYNEAIALAKEAEEALLFRNMQTDITGLSQTWCLSGNLPTGRPHVYGLSADLVRLASFDPSLPCLSLYR
jgi:LPS-assembly lipoprotein